ncbi:hypothetical protein BH10BAC2_BH10BAC2_11970 [soil metagenome]
MEEKTLDNMLHSLNSKTEDTWFMNVMQLNMDCIIALQTQKAKTTLRSLVWFKAVTLIPGILWVWFLVFLIIHSQLPEKIFFVISAGVIALVTAIAVLVYVKHIILIRQINNSANVTDTQLKLAKLQTSTLQIVRILFLQSPFYTTWFLTSEMLAKASMGILIFQICITGLFTFFSVWLYRNISYKNKDKKWFRILFNSPEWTSVNKAIAFIKEIDDFKNDK